MDEVTRPATHVYAARRRTRARYFPPAELHVLLHQELASRVRILALASEKLALFLAQLLSG